MVGRPAGPAGSMLVLGHGAGGDVTAGDLVAVRDAALAAGVTVALVTQPYRVAGRRSPAPAGHLDTAWLAVLERLSGERDAGSGGAGSGGAGSRAAGSGGAVIVGGRSSGARVACRTATAAGAAGIVALAFPLHPPGKPDRSRADELLTGRPTLVVNGDRDAFGIPVASAGVEVVVLPGETHALTRRPDLVASTVVTWLQRQGWA